MERAELLEKEESEKYKSCGTSQPTQHSSDTHYWKVAVDKAQVCFKTGQHSFFAPGVSYLWCWPMPRGACGKSKGLEGKKTGITGRERVTTHMLRLAMVYVTVGWPLSLRQRYSVMVNTCMVNTAVHSALLLYTISSTCFNGLSLTTTLQGRDYHHILQQEKWGPQRRRTCTRLHSGAKHAAFTVPTSPH